MSFESLVDEESLNEVLFEKIGCPENLFADQQKRLVETAIFCHPALKRLSLRWERYLGKHSDKVTAALECVGIESPSSALVSFVCKCLGSYKARVGASDSISIESERLVFQEYASRRCSDELRCEVCGYHFREIDLNSRRAALASEFSLKRADFVDPRRDGDPIKPIHREGKDGYYGKLELDHDVPLAALGWSESDNIKVLCRFCNVGKLNHRYPFEPLSSIISNSLAFSYEIDAQQARFASSVVAAIRASGGFCAETGVSTSEAELTVVSLPADEQLCGDWFVPWNLKVVAYDQWDFPT